MNKIYFFALSLLVLFSCEAILFEEDISDRAVVVLAPLNNSVIESANVNFNWNAVEDANNYQLQIATPNFVEAVQLATDSILPETAFSINLESGVYQWRVRALNENSETLYTTVNFTVQPEVFTEDISEEILTLIAPTEGALLTTNPMTFSWEEVNFSENYVLQIATPNFENATQIVVDEVIFDTSSEQSLEDGQYQWRVKAKNSATETAFFTSSFTVELSAIEEDISEEIVNLIAPSEGSILETNPIIFSWDEMPFAENYVLQIATPDFENPTQVVVDETLVGTSSEQTLIDGTYQWRVKAVNSVSQTAYSSSSFTVSIDGSADISNQTVGLIAPSNGAALTNSTNSFTWNAVPFAESYVLQIATPDFDNPTQVVVDQTLTETTSEQTLLDGQYQWRVKAVNSSSETLFSTANFSVLADGANDISDEIVSLIAPSNGADLTTNSVTFTWDTVTFAEDYVLQIATPDFINPIQVVVDETLTSTSSAQTIADGSYQWRVKARNSSSQTNYSTNSFSVSTGIDFPNREVVIISPPDNFVSNQSTLNIQWDAVEDATLYRIQVLDANTNELLDEQTTSQTNVPFTFPEGDLIWKVRAETTSQSTQYTAQNITIDSVAPNIPNLITPLDGDVLVSSSVTFTWSRVVIEGTTESDQIFIYEDAAQTILVLNQQVSGGSFTTTLTASQTYYWKMNAFDQAGNQSGDSSLFSFSIN